MRDFSFPEYLGEGGILAYAGGVKNRFFQYCFVSLKTGSDRLFVFGMVALALLGMIYAAISVRKSSVFSVDATALFREREAWRNAPYVETPMPKTPFPMPTVSKPILPDRKCRITDFGAVPGGEASNTESFRKAIASCAKAGGGRVVVPKGLWLTGPIHLESRIGLFLEKDSRVFFSGDFSEYANPVFSRFEGIEFYNYSPFIYANGAEDISVSGEGTLDGNGGVWKGWIDVQGMSLVKLEKMGDRNVPVRDRDFVKEGGRIQPSFLQFVECRRVLIEGVKIVNSPKWTIHPIYSSDITVRDIEVYTSIRNTDGIVLDSSRNAVIQDSLFRAGDDAVVVKSGKDRDGLRVAKPSENIVIHDILVEDGHGGVAFGSEMSGGIRNVFAYNVHVVRADFGIRFKTMRGRGGVVENIFFENMNVDRAVFGAIQMDMVYGTPFRADGPVPRFRNISFKNVLVKQTKSPYFLNGLPESPIANLSFENVRVSAIRDGKVANVVGESYRDIVVTKLPGQEKKNEDKDEETKEGSMESER